MNWPCFNFIEISDREHHEKNLLGNWCKMVFRSRLRQSEQQDIAGRRRHRKVGV